MSFILDALKKLEQKRQQDSVPNLSTIHTSHLHKSKKRALWPYLLFGALLLNAGILTVWLSPWSSESGDITAASPVVTNQEAAEVELSTKKELSLPDTQASVIVENAAPEVLSIKQGPPLKPSPLTEQPSLKAPEASAVILESSSKITENETTSSSQASEDDQAASLELTPSVEEIESLKNTIREEQGFTDSETLNPSEKPAESNIIRSEQGILELSELPLELRKEIPEISIFGHIYSNTPSSRLANINGSLVREGETVSGKLRVKEITMNGIIFDYQGLPFRMRAF